MGGKQDAADQDLLAVVQKSFLPRSVFAYRGQSETGVHHSPALEPLFAGRDAADGEPTLYICKNFSCQAPTKGTDAIKAAIKNL